jgi:vacuolar-type H+-ATPase catalytic subunit A/Vma1
MSDDPVPIISTPQTSALGDRIRHIANQMRQESEIQIKATSRILGAAAQIAQNHDQLINEVVEMVEEDLDQQAQDAEPYTAKKLQQQFKTLKAAKAHFDVKASSWVALAVKLNEQVSSSRSSIPQTQYSAIQRLETIEREVQTIRGDISHALNLLNLIAEKLL